MSSQPQATGLSQMKRSSNFYFQDLFIRAEDTLFKVHRQDFENGSEVFRHMFELPKADHKDEGSSAELPLVLEGIKAVDLEDFLAVVYPRSSKSESVPTSLDRWKAVFKLATMWEFEGVRAQALSAFKEHMRGANSIDTILLHQELDLDVDEDFVLAVQSVVEREEEISYDEAEKLELGTLMRLCTLRGWYSATRARPQLPSKICTAWNVPLMPGLAPQPPNQRRRRLEFY